MFYDHYIFFFPKIEPFVDSVVQTQNALLHLHCKHGYVNMPQCYAYIVCLVLLVSHLCLQLKFSLYFSSLGMLHLQSISSIHFIYVCWRTNYETFHFVVSPSYLTSSRLDSDLFFKFFPFDLKFLYSQRLRVKVSHR